MKMFRKWTGSKPQVMKELPSVDDESAQLTSDIGQNELILKQVFQNCSDIIFRKIHISGHTQWLIVYLESLVDDTNLDDHVLRPLMSGYASHDDSAPDEIEGVDDRVLPLGKIQRTSKVTDIVRHLLIGQVAILAAEDTRAMTVAVNGRVQRNPEEPPSELVLRGPRDGFIENISTNMGLLRSRIKTSRLKMEAYTVGELTQTEVVIAYVDGIADDNVIEEVRKRVTSIQIDGVLESGYIEQFIEDLPLSPFPQVNSTERPDVIAAGLLKGKIAILVDTTPFVLLVPMTFWTGLQASEDHYNRSIFATFVRWIRFLFIFISIFAPSLYVAVTTFHQEMIPTNLMLSIAAAREAVPFPALIETLLMETMFEALREAGVRMPRQVGQAVSIVGALVIGQAAVEAGIISAPVVIVVATTGIASFTVPRFNFANGIQLLRFPMILLAGTLGLYGIVLGFLGTLLHVTALRSFGTPYFTPLGPLTYKSLKDVLISAPIWEEAEAMRSSTAGTNNSANVRQGQPSNSNQGNRPSGGN
ncbi:spore germination protein KA [Paenibacillus prosopidis]|uniref:Spore germination protein KA n=2 Tax=Paenibacillus prosopidis TaxID=630520 RepID=A0A368VMM4_9BACL|nr:spore germination protein KA [Paenibacillus prosopidis]